MCEICGCSSDLTPVVENLIQQESKHTHSHPHSHDHEHGHGHDHSHVHEQDGAREKPPNRIVLEQRVLARNEKIAGKNRASFAERGCLAVNVLGTPGAGKTTLLARAMADQKEHWSAAVIEGDQATSRDAELIAQSGCEVLTLNTGKGCHLDASMIERALAELRKEHSLIVVENVGNLICPALFDLGEHFKIVVGSVTEGEDKPIKYPYIFRSASVFLLNKIDLLPHLDFDVDQCLAFAREVNPNIEIFQLSAKTGEGLEPWYDWLNARMTELKRVSNAE